MFRVSLMYIFMIVVLDLCIVMFFSVKEYYLP